MKKYVFIDVDGTLLTDGQELVSDKVLTEIRNVQKDGVRVVLNTGRNFNQCYDLAMQLGINDMILVNGQTIIKNGVMIKDDHIPNDTSSNYVNYLKQEKINFAITYNDKYIMEKMRFAKYVMRTLRKYSYGKMVCGVNDCVDVKSIWVFAKEVNISKVLTKLALNDDVNYYTHGSKSIEILSKNHDKAQGIKDFLKSEEARTFAIGDSYNDIRAFEECDYSFAMANSIDELKENATVIVPSVVEEGAANALAMIAQKKYTI